MIRRAMSKKKHAVIDAERIAFVHGDEKRGIPGAVANGVPEAVANSIYDEILAFASYAFNKAHAVSYAVVCYRTAYMKRHYPQEYMAALLTSILDNSVKVAEYISECREMGIRLLPPDVNESDANFTVSGENIRFGLVAIKGIGWNVINALSEERRRGGPFRSFEDFCKRMIDHGINKTTVGNLVRAGAFDSMGYNRRSIYISVPYLLDAIASASKKVIDGQASMFDSPESGTAEFSFQFPNVEDYSLREKIIMEKEVTGLYLSAHPMDEFRERVRSIGAVPIGVVMNDFSEAESEHCFHDGQKITVAGIVSSSKTKATKNNSLMSYVQLEDDSGSMELLVFQKVLEQSGPYIVDNAVLAVTGRISVREEKAPQIMVDSIRPLESCSPERGPESEAAGAPAQNAPAAGQTLYVRFPSQEDPRFSYLEKLLIMFPGNGKLVVWFEKEKKRVGARCLIHPALMAELKERLGEENVVLK